MKIDYKWHRCHPNNIFRSLWGPQGRITFMPIVETGSKSNLSEILCLSSLSASFMIKIVAIVRTTLSPLYVYGTFWLPRKPKFWSDLPHNQIQPIPYPNNGTCEIWSRLANWPWRYICLKVWTTLGAGGWGGDWAGNFGVILVRVCEPVFQNLLYSYTWPLKKRTHSYTWSSKMMTYGEEAASKNLWAKNMCIYQDVRKMGPFHIGIQKIGSFIYFLLKKGGQSYTWQRWKRGPFGTYIRTMPYIGSYPLPPPREGRRTRVLLYF